MSNNHQQWDEDLSLIQTAINRTVGIYQYSSEEIMFGAASPSALDLLTFTEPEGSLDTYMDRVKLRLEKIYSTVARLRQAKRKSKEDWTNLNTRARKFEVGDLVNKRDLAIQRHSALAAPFKGPYIVKETSKYEHTALLENLVTGRLTKVHYNHMEKIQHPPMTYLNSDWDKDLKTLIQHHNNLTPANTENFAPTDDSDSDPEDTNN
jgi:hypothetical protein